MRKYLKPDSVMFPLPVLVIGTYDKDGKPNAMTVAWGGIYDTNQVFICLSSNHKTTENIRFNGVFSVSFATKDTVEIADYYGIKSGYDEDKISVSKVKVERCAKINAPYFNEFPVHLECKVRSFKEENATCYIVADILAIYADENVLNKEDKIAISKLQPIAYNPSEHTYNIVKEKVGDAFKCGLRIK